MHPSDFVIRSIVLVETEILRTIAEAQRDSRKRIWHELHRCPEKGNAEIRTAKIVRGTMEQMGIEVTSCAGTGLVGVLHGAGEGRCVALRAELDALPIREKTGASFSSQNEGFMHACGHDLHMAALLAAAQMLSMTRRQWNGCVKFFFQPDEEGDGGAARMIAEGCLERPHVDAVFGMHVLPKLPEGAAAFCFGPSFAASDTFQIRVTGRACHGAQPQEGIDALAAACSVVQACTAIPKSLPQGERAVVSFGMFSAGTAGNIIPGEAAMRGIIRTLGAPVRKKVRELFVKTAAEAAAENGAHAEVLLHESYPGVTNAEESVNLAMNAARELELPVQVLPEAMMMTEDFGYFLNERPGCFYHIGAGTDVPLHSPEFLPGEKALENAALLHVRTVLDFLRTTTK